MQTTKKLKIFLAFLSLSLSLLVSCGAESMLGSKTQNSQISEDNNGVGKISNLPTWNKDYVQNSAKGEFDGTWQPINGRGYLIWISDGGLVHVRGGYQNEYEAAIGKIEDNFNYPYIINLKGTNNVNRRRYYSGTVIFHNATNLDFYFNSSAEGGYIVTNTYYKYSDKLICEDKEFTKKEILDAYPWLVW